MADAWYYTQAGQRNGPVSFEALRQMAGSGQLQPVDLVWTEGMAQWAVAAHIPQLSPTFAASASATAAGPIPAGPLPLGYGHVSYETSYAGFWLRFCAAFVDGLVTAVAGWIVGAFFSALVMPGAATPIAGRGMPRAAIGLMVALQVINMAMGWLYFSLMESSSAQATLGKMALGIRVTDEGGARLSFGRATGRHFGKWVSAFTLGIGYIMAGFTERKQALHDIMARALVVKKNPAV